MNIVSDITKSLNNISMNQWTQAKDQIQGNNKVTDDKKKKFEENKYKPVNIANHPPEKEVIQGSIHDIKVQVIFSDRSNTGIDITRYIRSFLVVKLFEDFMKPVYKINMDLPISIILTLERAVQYKYRVEIKTAPYDKSQYDNSFQPPAGSSNIKKELATDVYLIPYMKPPSMISPEIEKRIKSGDTAYAESRISYSVECFDKRHVKSGHKLMNAVYRCSTPTDIMKDLFLKNVANFRGCGEMSFKKPDLEEVFEHIVLPPLSYVDAINFLQKTFNFYKRKPLVYMDEKVIYLIKRGDIAHAGYSNRKMKRLVIIVGDLQAADGSSKVGELMATLNKNKDDIVVVAEDKPAIYDKTHVVSQEVGDRSIVKSDSSTEGVTSMCLGMKDDGKTATTCSIKYQDKAKFLHSDYEGKETFVEENGSGRYYMELKIDQMQVDNLQIHLLLRNVNLKYFTIVTPILLKFTDEDSKAYDGLYFLRAAHTMYRRTPNSNTFDAFTRIELSRKYNDDGSVAT